MEAVNGRLIIQENEIDKACERLTQIVNTKLTLLSLSDTIKCQIYNYENYNECFWNELWIDLFKDGELLGGIEYVTESLEPQLVCDNGQFNFYFVFDLVQHTCTNARTLRNMAHHDMKMGDEFLENIIIDEINLKASRLTLINNLLNQ